MIVVKIEMWPWGIKDRMYELGRMYIANTGEAKVAAKGNYNVKVCRRKASYDFKDWESIKATREARVENYPRLSYNVWRLILRALRGSFPEEK